MRARQRGAEPDRPVRHPAADLGRVAAADDPPVAVDAGKREIHILVAGMQIGQEMREPLVDIAYLQVLQDVEMAPGGGVLQTLEHHLVDVRGDPGRLDGEVAFDLRLHRLARLDKSQAGQKYGGQKADAEEGDE